ncbi:MAG: hypothetical protein OHK0021_01970 [Bryobacter sp.]
MHFEAKRAHGMGREFEQPAAFPQRFAHQGKIEVLQVAQAAVDQMGIFAAGARAPEMLFDYKDAQNLTAQLGAKSKVPRKASAIDTPADYDDVEVLAVAGALRKLNRHKKRLPTQARALTAPPACC